MEPDPSSDFVKVCVFSAPVLSFSFRFLILRTVCHQSIALIKFDHKYVAMNRYQEIKHESYIFVRMHKWFDNEEIACCRHFFVFSKNFGFWNSIEDNKF